MRPKIFNLPITLNKKQLEIDASTARFKILKWGRRAGKTRYGAYWLIKNAITNPGLHWHINKNLELIRDEVWSHLVALAPRELIKRVDDVRLQIHFNTPNGPSKIVCKSGEKEDNLRGRGLRSLWVDEASFMRPTMFDTVLRAALADYEAPALITSSPRRGWFTQQFAKAQCGRLKDWGASHATIYDNEKIKREEIEDIRIATPEHVWLQEFMAQEIENSGVVYAEFDERNIFNPAREYRDYKDYQCVLGADYGLSDPTGVIWIHIAPDGTLLWTEDYCRNGVDIALHAETIISRSAGLKIAAEDYVLDLVNFRREGAAGGISVGEKFKQCGVHFTRGEKSSPVQIDQMKRLMRGCEARPYMRVSVRCTQTIEAFRSWEHGGHEPDTLAAGRYATTHILKKRMTVIADLLPKIDGHTKYASTDGTLPPCKMILPRLQRGPKRDRFDWDYDAGGPA